MLWRSLFCQNVASRFAWCSCRQATLMVGCLSIRWLQVRFHTTIYHEISFFKDVGRSSVDIILVSVLSFRKTWQSTVECWKLLLNSSCWLARYAANRTRCVCTTRKSISVSVDIYRLGAFARNHGRRCSKIRYARGDRCNFKHILHLGSQGFGTGTHIHIGSTMRLLNQFYLASIWSEYVVLL